MNNFQDDAVSSISYTVIERMIVKFEQKTKKITYKINLSAQKITTANHTFPLHAVFDISYKPFSGTKGLLYLHTNQGVLMYEIETDPSEFIRSYKNIRTP